MSRTDHINPENAKDKAVKDGIDATIAALKHLYELMSDGEDEAMLLVAAEAIMRGQDVPFSHPFSAEQVNSFKQMGQFHLAMDALDHSVGSWPDQHKWISQMEQAAGVFAKEC